MVPIGSLRCTVCGHNEFEEHEIIWDLLATQWQLSSSERHYIDLQQGKVCTNCNANLRSIALADAIRSAVNTRLTFADFAASGNGKDLAILEINEAGSLTPTLKKFPGHRLVMYPEVDIHDMPFSDEEFDLVIHSDTLEHVVRPVHALAECRRVLRPEGWLCFTVPTIVGRMSRGREGLEKSFHGEAGKTAGDFAVHTEFGADMWTTALQAGFTAVTIHAVEYPAALALSAQKPRPVLS